MLVVGEKFEPVIYLSLFLGVQAHATSLVHKSAFVQSISM